MVPCVCAKGRGRNSGAGKNGSGTKEENREALLRRRAQRPRLEFRRGARNIGQAGPDGKKKGGRAGARFATDPRARVRACVRVISRTDRRTDERYASHGHATDNPGTDVREGPLVICFSCNTGNYFDRSHERGAAGNNGCTLLSKMILKGTV